MLTKYLYFVEKKHLVVVVIIYVYGNSFFLTKYFIYVPQLIQISNDQ